MAVYAIRRNAALALAALTMSACGLFEPAPLSTERPLALPPTPTPATTAPTPVSTPTPAPSPEVPSPPPPPLTPEVRFVPALPDDDEDDLRRIYDDLVAAAASLGDPPDPTRVEDVYTESCPCFGEFFTAIEELAALGHRGVGPGPETLEFRVLRPASDGVSDGWNLEAVRRYDGGRVVDADGRTVRELPPIERQRVLTTVLRHEGLWKFANVEFPDG